MGGHIFISYRRVDAGHAGRMCDRLRSHFGADKVFMDLDTIPPGSVFGDVIDRAIGSCEAFVVLIGEEWLSQVDRSGRRRLDDPEDFVRLEIGAVLRRQALVVPVLIEGATMPPGRDLPQEIAKLSGYNALELSDARWDYDMGRLIGTLESAVGAPAAPKAQAAPDGGAPPKPRRRALVIGGVAVAAAAAIFLAGRALTDDGDGPGGGVQQAGSTGAVLAEGRLALDRTDHADLETGRIELSSKDDVIFGPETTPHLFGGHAASLAGVSGTQDKASCTAALSRGHEIVNFSQFTGDAVCVATSEGNIAVLRNITLPGVGNTQLSFDYTVWR